MYSYVYGPLAYIAGTPIAKRPGCFERFLQYGALVPRKLRTIWTVRVYSDAHGVLTDVSNGRGILMQMPPDGSFVQKAISTGLWALVVCDIHSTPRDLWTEGH